MLDSLDTLIAFVLIMLVVSLLITIVVQMFSALFNLRGLNLAQGLKRTFAVIDPDSDQDAKELANFVLKGRFLSDSFLPNWGIFKLWRHAEAIRANEVFDAIQRIAIGKEPVDERLWKESQRSKPGKNPVRQDSNLREYARKLLIALGVDEEAIKKAEEEIKTAQESTNQLTDAANAVLAKLSPDDRANVQDAFNKITGRLEAAGKSVASQIAGAAKTIDAAYQKFEYWNCISQERAQQWLTMHTRVLTIIFAIIAAFALQLDTVEILKLVSSNKSVRDKLVAQAGAVEAQAAKVLGDSSTVLREALKSWNEKETDPEVKSAIAGIDVKDTDTREEVRDKVIKALSGKTPKESFDSIVNDTAIQRLDKQAGNFRIVKADFDKTGFELLPTKALDRWEEGRWNWKGHYWGMLFSAAFLSLGAPFWYNLLKNLSSLRSTVAQNISNEQKQEQADGTSSKPPPTVTAS